MRKKIKNIKKTKPVQKSEIKVSPFMPLTPGGWRGQKLAPIGISSIDNFKSIKKAVFGTSKINLIYGKNSSGKSSIIHSMLFTKPDYQGGLRYDGLLPLFFNERSNFLGNYGGTDSTFDLGNFSQILNASAKKEGVVELSYSDFDGNNLKSSINMSFGDGAAGMLLHFIDYKKEHEYQREVFKVDFEGILTFTPSMTPARYNPNIPFYNLNIDDEKKFFLNKKKLKESLIRSLYFAPGFVFIDDSKKTKEDLKELEVFVSIIKEFIESFNTRVIHIPPIRSIPGRFNVDPNDPVQNHLLETLQDESYPIKKLNTWLGNLGIDYEIGIESGSNIVGGNYDVLYLVSKNAKKKRLSFHDVGKGLSQVLPILLVGAAERNTTILVEQPEIHLHPKMQSDLAELFSDTENNNRWFIETHSENLLFRLQKKVREGDLSADDVSIIYVDIAKTGNAEVKNIFLQDNGKLTEPFPKGFFDVGLNDLIPS